MARSPQTVPIKIYRSQECIMIASPMPGLRPEDISVTISGQQVTIRGEARGSRQYELDLILDEWSTGPYQREINLPGRVNGSLSNATYGNGVLVLSMPVVRAGEKSTDANFQLSSIEATRGERVGHTGKEVHPTTTQAHMRKHR